MGRVPPGRGRARERRGREGEKRVGRGGKGRAIPLNEYPGYGLDIRVSRFTITQFMQIISCFVILILLWLAYCEVNGEKPFLDAY